MGFTARRDTDEGLHNKGGHRRGATQQGGDTDDGLHNKEGHRRGATQQGGTQTRGYTTGRTQTRG